jgi:hypothetical protein
VRLRLAAMQAEGPAGRKAELRRRLDRTGQHGADAGDLAAAPACQRVTPRRPRIRGGHRTGDGRGVAGRQQQMMELGLRDLEERMLAGLAGELLELRTAARGLRNLDLGAE